MVLPGRSDRIVSNNLVRIAAATPRPSAIATRVTTPECHGLAERRSLNSVLEWRLSGRTQER